MNKWLVILLLIVGLPLGCRNDEEEAETSKARPGANVSASDKVPEAARETEAADQPEGTAEATAPVTDAGSTEDESEGLPASAASATGSPSASSEIVPTTYLASSILDEYVGYYEVPPGVILHVTKEGDQLFVQAMGMDKFPVYAESATKFSYKEIDAQITFVRSDAGEITSLILHQAGLDQTGARLPAGYEEAPAPKEVKLEPGVIEGYAGEYELEKGGMIDVVAEEGKLRVTLPSRPPFQVFPESDTKFFFKVLDMRIVFLKDAAGAVTGLRLDRGNLYRVARKVE